MLIQSFKSLLLNLYFPSAVLLREVLLILLHLGFLDLDGLYRGSLEGFLNAALGELRCVPDIDGLEPGILIKRLGTDLIENLRSDNEC